MRGAGRSHFRTRVVERHGRADRIAPTGEDITERGKAENMTIGSDNLSNGSATAQDRFSGGVSAYRQNRREALAVDADGELVSRGGSASGLPTRSPGRSHTIEPTGALDRAAKLPSLDLQGLAEPVFSPAERPGIALHRTEECPPEHPGTALSRAEGYLSVGWTDPGSASRSMADHPLLRGLLLELPERGTLPPSDWLDRWFEAARSILELLYVQEARKG
jgi:hypothetical protein